MKEGAITAAGPVDADVRAQSRWRQKKWRRILLFSVPLLLLLVGGYFWLTSGRYISTDNAYVQQDMAGFAV